MDSNHIFPLHKCTVANALMKGDALPLDYRVNNHVKKFWYLLYELFIHLIQGLYVQAKRFLLTVFTIFPPFTYLLIWNIQSYFSIIISHFLKMYVANSTQDLENITKSSNDISSYLFGATSFENLASVLKLYFCNLRYSFS